MPTNARKYAKFIAALLTAALAAAAEFALPIPEQAVGWTQLVVSLLGVVAVYGIPNVQDDAEPAEPEGA